jgi:hypothetical protein
MSLYTTTADHIINELEYGSGDEGTLPADLEKTKVLLLAWLYNSSAYTLSNFVRSITGQPAIFKGRKLKV